MENIRMKHSLKDFFEKYPSKFWVEVYIDLPFKANLTESPRKIHPHLAQTVVPSCDQMIPSTLTLQNQNDYKKNSHSLRLKKKKKIKNLPTMVEAKWPFRLLLKNQLH